MSKLSRKAARKSAIKHARGKLGYKLRNGMTAVIEPEEREARHKRAQNTPYLDKMLAMVNKQSRE